jgi:hypothetical protein
MGGCADKISEPLDADQSTPHCQFTCLGHILEAGRMKQHKGAEVLGIFEYKYQSTKVQGPHSCSQFPSVYKSPVCVISSTSSMAQPIAGAADPIFSSLGPRMSLFVPPEPAAGELIILCTWLGAGKKHIAKYVTEYRRIAPHARILLIESSVWIITTSYVKQREAIQPAAEVVWALLDECVYSAAESTTRPTIVIHTFSNGGESFLTSTPAAHSLISPRHKLSNTAPHRAPQTPQPPHSHISNHMRQRPRTRHVLEILPLHEDLATKRSGLADRRSSRRDRDLQHSFRLAIAGRRETREPLPPHVVG